MRIVEEKPVPLTVGKVAQLTDTPSPVPAPASAPARVPDKCIVARHKDGTLTVTFKIEPDVAKRLIGRAGGVDLAKYLYDNVLYRSIIGHVY